MVGQMVREMVMRQGWHLRWQGDDREMVGGGGQGGDHLFALDKAVRREAARRDLGVELTLGEIGKLLQPRAHLRRVTASMA